jgi:hypothetical protein
MLENDTFLLRQLAGGVVSPIEVFDDADNNLAYIHLPARPMRGCLTILICVVTFFLFPIVTVWILGVICDWIDVISPLDIDRRQSAVVPVITLILIVAVGFLVTMFVGSVVHPKRRIDIYADKSRRQPLFHLVEVRKSKFNVATLLLTDVDGIEVGRLRQDHRHDQIDLLDHVGQRVATYCAKPNSTPAEWNRAAVLTLVVGVLIGLLLSSLLVFVPKRGRKYTKSALWSFDEGTGEQAAEIGTLVFDPHALFQYTIDLSADPARSLDRRFVLALATLLEW